MNKSLSAPELHEPTRLDKFLHAALPDYSRSVLQRAIREGNITVNDKKVVVHHWLKSGDSIELKNLAEPIKITVTPNKDVPYKLIAETADYLIIDKPAGLVVHPAAGVNEPTLVDGLIAKYPEIASVGDDPLRPGIVHRLDREVSGLLVITRNNQMYEHLKKQFQDRTIDKDYVGLVIGQLSQPSGTINFPLARSKRNHGKIAARNKAGDDTREAITHYAVAKQWQKVTLLKLKLETGRTHQIRAHLAALGYPLVGDQLYRPPKLAFKNTPGRIFLHAQTLSFTDLSSQRQTFSSPLPKELSDFLNSLS